MTSDSFNQPATVRVAPSRSQRSLAKLARIVDTGIVVLDKDRALEMVGERFCELIAVPTCGDDEESKRAFVGHATWIALLEAFEPLLDRFGGDEETEAQCDLEVSAPQGIRRLRFKLFALDGGGVMIQARDRRALEALETDLRLAAYHRSLSRLYLGAAHDLKGPLNSLYLQLEVLQRTIARCDPEAGEKDRLERTARTLRAELERLWSMVESLLSQTAPASGKLERCDLAAILRETVRQVTSQARQQRISLTVDCAEDLELPTVGHPEQLRQVLLNLFVNALEAMEEGGTLHVDCQANASWSEVRLKDSGPGIDPEIAPRLFEMHVTNKAGGTGIGLWVVHNTLSAHGGSIEIEDTGPGGSTFLVRLPTAGAVEPQRPPRGSDIG